MTEFLNIEQSRVETVSIEGILVSEGTFIDNVLKEYSQIDDIRIELSANDYMYFVVRGTFYIIYASPKRIKSMPFYMEQYNISFLPYLESRDSKKRYLIHFYVDKSKDIKYRIYLGDVD